MKRRIRLTNPDGIKRREFTREIPDNTRVIITERGVFVLAHYAPDKEGKFNIQVFRQVTAARIP